MHRHTPWLIRSNRIDHTLQEWHSWTFARKSTWECRTRNISCRQVGKGTVLITSPVLAPSTASSQSLVKLLNLPLFRNLHYSEEESFLMCKDLLNHFPERKFQPISDINGKKLQKSYLWEQSCSYIQDRSGFVLVLIFDQRHITNLYIWVFSEL